MAKITIVTGNPNKAKEIASILDGLEVDFQSFDIPEIQSFELEEIVRHKAQAAFLAAHGPVIVEDVSFQVEALGNFPGPFVKFWEKNVGYDLAVRIAEQAGNMSATVRCGVGYADYAQTLYAEGVVKGKLVARRGGEGFGFDYYFMPEEYTQTFSEMGKNQKNKISHRARALQAMRNTLHSVGIIMNIQHTSECPVCGGKEIATGKKEEREGGFMYYEMQCTECKSTGGEWHKEWDI